MCAVSPFLLVQGCPVTYKPHELFLAVSSLFFFIVMMICKQQVMSFKHACDDVGAKAMAIGVCMGMLETKSKFSKRE